jgi:hypothetical protein
MSEADFFLAASLELFQSKPLRRFNVKRSGWNRGVYSFAGVLRGSRSGLRSGPSLRRFRPGRAGVRRSVSRCRGDAGLPLDRLAMTVDGRASVQRE